MLSARDSRDGEETQAVDFDTKVRRDPSVRDAYRNYWQCIGCGDFAWFRQRSRDGRPAGFSSHHFGESECDFAGRREDAETGELDESGGPISNSAQVLVLHGTEPSMNPVRHADGTSSGHGSGRGTDSSGTTSYRQESRLALPRLLAHLEKGTNFSGRTIRVPHAGEQDGGDVIREFNELTGQDTNQWRIVWGQAYSARPTDYAWFLNQGPVGRSTATIYTPTEMADTILTKHRKQQLEAMHDLDGWSFIIVGQVTTTRDERYRVDLHDAGLIALRPPKP